MSPFILYFLAAILHYVLGGFPILDYVGDCGKTPRASFVNVSKIVNSKKESLVYLTASVQLFRPVNANKLHVDLNIERCVNKDQPHTCIKMPALKSRKACALMYSKNFLVADYAKCVNVSGCMFNKSEYFFYAKNCPIDIKAFRAFPIGGFHWNVKINIMEDISEKQIFCIDVLVNGKAM